MVEDDASIRALCGRILQGAGFDPVLFDSAAEALRAISDKTGCLVTDLNMPKMGGLELLRAILAARPELPVLAMTGSAPPEELEEIRKLGVEVLSKPFRPEEFVSRVRQCLASSIG
ncbi:MAG TPA: response regulator, partial [Planctomycetota bacterium]|nr:response regulator [Planctomycetota bacterium]